MHGIVARTELSAEERAEVERLVALCNQEEGIRLPINLDPSDKPDQPNHFLYYEGDMPVGYANVEGVHTPEAIVVVHPEHRRKGIGRKLLHAVKEEIRLRSRPTMLLVVDEAGSSGKPFAKAVGTQYRFSEHSMVLEPARIDRSRPRIEGLSMRRAGPEDVETIARIIAAAFGDSLDFTRQHVTSGMGQANQRYFLADLDGDTVGTLRIGEHDPAVYVTAFGVLPQRQGHGYGRQMLLDTVDMLLAERRPDIRIEVETENHNALGLYQSCGFKETATYGYYRIEL